LLLVLVRDPQRKRSVYLQLKKKYHVTNTHAWRKRQKATQHAIVGAELN
jgi:hypothetical protein